MHFILWLICLRPVRELENELASYKCCVICMVDIRQRASLSCGHTFW